MSKCAAGDVTFSWGGVEFKAPPSGEYPRLSVDVGGEIELEDNGEVSKAEGISIMGLFLRLHLSPCRMATFTGWMNRWSMRSVGS